MESGDHPVSKGDEPCITPEMVEAGVEELRLWDTREDQLSEIVVCVYEAMQLKTRIHHLNDDALENIAYSYFQNWNEDRGMGECAGIGLIKYMQQRGIRFEGPNGL